MKENNNRTLIYLVLLIAITITAVGVATFAYFSSSVEANANVPLNVATANGSVFTASSEGGIDLDLGFEQMSEANVSTNIVATDNATVTVKLDSESENDTMVCTYDLVWVWDSVDKYTEADAKLPIDVLHKENILDELGYSTWEELLADAGSEQELINIFKMDPYSNSSFLSTYNYEFSTMIDNAGEKDLSSFKWNEVNSKYEAIIGSGKIKINGKGSTTNTHEIAVSAYNIPMDQQNLFNKEFKAHIEVKNNVCKAVEREYAYHEICNDDSASCTIAKLYTTDGINGLYYHDGIGTYTNYRLEAKDNSYRYAGADPENYLCFKKNCTDEEKYRIIGVLDNKIKVIKLININPDKILTWNSTDGFISENIWEGSSLEQYLNNETDGYLSTIKEYKDLIADTNWITSGAPYGEIELNVENNAKRTYDFEIAENCDYCGNAKAERTMLNRKIGLMYVSDYMYAASPEYWNLAGRNSDDDETKDYRASIGNDWLLSSNSQWTISRQLPNVDFAFNISYDGDVGGVRVPYKDYAVHPVFYLASFVKLIDGSGSLDDPYIVSL